MSFPIPYSARIVTAIGNDEFELVRFQRQIQSSDIKFWTEGREDRSWVERPLKDHDCDTPRQAFRELSKPGGSSARAVVCKGLDVDIYQSP